ncbi:MAG: hypothetical protein M3Z25_12105 [Actinomycetota bacterium]|nr:hypothetical protein [Actinomycetota bacterium]
MNAKQSPTYAELNAVLDQARRPSNSPTPVTDAQLLGLQSRWSAMLSARLDQAIEDSGYGPTADAVADAWRRLAADQPVLRGVLDDGQRRSAVLTEAMAGEFRNLALAADLAGLDEPAARAAQLGREFRDLLTAGRAPLHQVA